MFKKISSIICKSFDKLHMSGASFNGRIVEHVLFWDITQQFENNEKQAVELLYHFPMGAAASLMSVKVRVGSRQFTCEVFPEQDAQSSCTDSLASEDSAILVEQDSELRYFMRIGNILPGEQINIQLQTGELLQIAQGSCRIALPSCLPNSFSMLNGVSNSEENHPVIISSLHKQHMTAGLQISGLLSGARISSPSHKLKVSHSDGLVIEVAGRAFLDRNFQLNFDQLPQQSPVGLWLKNPHAASTLPGEYLGFVNYIARPVPISADMVHLKILLDCSSSMHGESMELGKSVLLYLLESMTTQDQVSLSRFGDSCQHLLDATAPFTPQIQQAMKSWVDEISASMGKAQMAMALRQVTQIGSTGPADILLITGGEVEALAEMVQAAAESQHRVFVLAIGASPQNSSLATLARVTGGAVEFVQMDSNLAEAASRLVKCLKGGSYAGVRVYCEGLLDASVSSSNIGFDDCSFPLMMMSNAPDFSLALHAERQASRSNLPPELNSIPFRLIEDPQLAELMCKLLVARRIQTLLDLWRLDSNRSVTTFVDPWLVGNVMELGVRFGLVTPFTFARLSCQKSN